MPRSIAKQCVSKHAAAEAAPPFDTRPTLPSPRKREGIREGASQDEGGAKQEQVNGN
ncbi:MAG: hypothetical protein QOC56_1708 [Alphaproteobacteria bacterium]|nr:hypothetical protein [Alphaproteobacteria bacterium]